jgi:hypothetical protein
MHINFAKKFMQWKTFNQEIKNDICGRHIGMKFKLKISKSIIIIIPKISHIIILSYFSQISGAFHFEQAAD